MLVRAADPDHLEFTLAVFDFAAALMGEHADKIARLAPHTPVVHALLPLALAAVSAPGVPGVDEHASGVAVRAWASLCFDALLPLDEDDRGALRGLFDPLLLALIPGRLLAIF